MEALLETFGALAYGEGGAVTATTEEGLRAAQAASETAAEKLEESGSALASAEAEREKRSVELRAAEKSKLLVTVAFK